MRRAGRYSSPSPPPSPSRPGELLTSWQAFAAIATAILGLGAYVYVLGGIVAWLRIVAARLPNNDVTSAFESRALLAFGVQAILFEVTLAVVLAVVISATQRVATLLDRRHDEPMRNRFGNFGELAVAIVLRSVLAGLLGASILAWLGGSSGKVQLWSGVAIAIVFGALELWTRQVPFFLDLSKDNSDVWAQKTAFHKATHVSQLILIFAILIFAVFKLAAAPCVAILVILILLLLVDHFPVSTNNRRIQRRRRLAAVAIGTLALNLIIVTYMAAPPVKFDRARLTLTNGSHITGAFIGRSGDGVYLGFCRPTGKNPDHSEDARVHFFPDEEIKGITLGGFAYRFDVGRRPTLFALTKHFLMDEDLGGNDDGIDLDLRHEQPACGVKD